MTNKETIVEMRNRHKKEIAELQGKCKHKRISEWMPFMWAPGHLGNEVKMCITCDKIVEEKRRKS